MVRQKRSFFEKLTGSVREEEESSRPEEPGEPEKEVTPEPPPPSLPQEEAEEGQLAVDVYQTEDAIVIKSTVAGVKPQGLDVNITNDMVTVRGERRCAEEIKDEDYYYQECYWGAFSRSIVLPVDVIAEEAEAHLKDGILTIVLPKAVKTVAKTIQVKGE